MAKSEEFTVSSGGVELAGEDAGEGIDTILLHGLTATRRYVLMGSRALERAGHRVVTYDARGHGRSSGASDYGYDTLARDLEAVMDDRGIDQAVLVGASMGAHTLVRFAAEHPERVRAGVIVTPAFDPNAAPDLERWDRLATGLREGGVNGFVQAYGTEHVPEKWRETVDRILRQRMGEHADLGAVADALETVPRSRPFESWADLGSLKMPTLVVGSRDEADPEHPLETAERYAEALPDSRSVVEPPGASPLAWQGGRLARCVAEAF